MKTWFNNRHSNIDQKSSITVKLKDKPYSEFGHLKCVAKIAGNPINSPLWCLEFSTDGKFLAYAGHAGCVGVFKTVLASETGNIPLVDQDALMFKGHKSDVVDIAWSPLNFLASASLDNSVRLWHLAQSDCLCIFEHPDAVTCVAFSPTNPTVLVTGCLDGTVRLWVIGESMVKFWHTVPDGKMITAICFTANGSLVAAGTINGTVVFLDPEAGLEPRSILKDFAKPRSKNFLKQQIRQAETNFSMLLSGNVIGKSGHQFCSACIPNSVLEKRYRKQLTRNKINGIRPMRIVPQLKTVFNAAAETLGSSNSWALRSTNELAGLFNSQCKDSSNALAKLEKEIVNVVHTLPTSCVVISSNSTNAKIVDSRFKTILARLDGNCIKNAQIKTNFSPDGLYAISGSERNFIYIWNTIPSNMRRPNIQWAKRIWAKPKASSRISSPNSTLKIGSVYPPAGESDADARYVTQYPQSVNAGEGQSKNGFERLSGFTRYGVLCATFAPTILEVAAFHHLQNKPISSLDASVFTGFQQLREKDPGSNRLIAAADTTGLIYLLFNEVL